MALKHTHTIHIQWEPGNGTRYDVLITALEQTFMGHAAAGTYLVTASDRSPLSFVTSKGGFLHFSYVQEKLHGMGIQDACVVTEMVAAALDREFCVVDEPWYRESVPEFAPVYEEMKRTGAIKQPPPRI